MCQALAECVDTAGRVCICSCVTQGALAECVDKELDARLRGSATRKVLAIKTSDIDLREQFSVAVTEDKYEKVSCVHTYTRTHALARAHTSRVHCLGHGMAYEDVFWRKKGVGSVRAHTHTQTQTHSALRRVRLT